MTRTTSIKKWLRLGLISGLFVFIIAFSFFQTTSLKRGSVITIENLTDGAVFETAVVALSGTAIHTTHLSVNGREIPVDEESRFSDELVLSPGYNIITISGSDKFKQQKSLVYRVLYREPLNPMAEARPDEHRLGRARPDDREVGQARPDERPFGQATAALPRN